MGGGGWRGAGASQGSKMGRESDLAGRERLSTPPGVSLSVRGVEDGKIKGFALSGGHHRRRLGL